MDNKINPRLYSLGYKLKRVNWVMHYWLFEETHFAWLEALTMLLKNPMNFYQWAQMDLVFFNVFCF